MLRMPGSKDTFSRHDYHKMPLYIFCTEAFSREQFLLAAIAATHAFISCFAVAAFAAGFNLNGLQRAIFFISAMVAATGYAAADMGVGLFLRHNGTS